MIFSLPNKNVAKHPVQQMLNTVKMMETYIIGKAVPMKLVVVYVNMILQDHMIIHLTNKHVVILIVKIKIQLIA